MPFANKECIGSLRGYQSNEKTCIANNVPIDCSKPPLPPRAAAPATTGCRRNIFLDMGANWCNTMQLYKDVPEAAPAAGLAHAGLPWHVFAVEAAPLIAPYVELCTEALAAGRPLPTPLVPPAGSSMQLLKYAKELGCEKAGGRREVLACIAKALDGPLAALGRTANPKLTANMALLRARLDGARTRGGCEAVPRHAGLLSAFSRAPDPSFRADGLATSGGGTYTLLPAAAGASEGVLRMAGSPLQMLRGGTTAAGGSHQPQFDVPTIDVVQWMRASFSEDDFVILKMDVEGAEIDIVPKLLATNTTRLVDVFLWECHAKWRGAKGKCQCAQWEEHLRRAGVRHVYREKYPFASHEKSRAAVWNVTAARAAVAAASRRRE